MIAAIWIVFAVLLATWTMTVWLASALTSWAAEALQSAGAPGAIKLPDVVAHLPGWLKDWMPGDLLELLPPMLAGAQQAAVQLAAAVPWAGTAIGWLVPLLWVGWFFVTLGLLLVTILLHVLVRRSRRASVPAV